MSRGSKRIAIVGAGLMGRWHAVYAPRAGARIVAVVDADPGRAEPVAAACGAQSFTATDAWLEQQLDVVHVCTPSDTHAAVVERALEAGCHAVVEKPLATTVAETRRLIDLAAAHQRHVIAVHQLPFQAGMTRLRRQLPLLGPLRSVVYRTFTAGGEGLGLDRRRALLREILPHPVSLLFALGFEHVEADAWRVDRSSDDGLTLTAQAGPTRLEVVIDLQARPTRNEIEIAGASGTAVADLFHGFCSIDRAPLGRRSKLLRPFRIAARSWLAAGSNLTRRTLGWVPAYPGLPELLDAFYRGLAVGEEPPIGRAELIAAAELMARLDE